MPSAGEVQPVSAPPPRAPLLFAAAAAAVSLVYAAYTGHMWEDYFITFRASLNLATGNGLVFQPGERVHTYTSPLGTLLPALFAVGGGEGVALRALWGLRLVSALALGGAVALALRAFRRDGLVPFAAGAIGVAWVLDPKIVDFSMNGMETAFVVFFVTFTWHAFTSGARLWPVAIAFAGLQWTRPDGAVFFAVIAAGWLGFGGGTWLARLGAILRGAGVGLLFYLPWIAWAWSYYGTPVPHTILAKAQHLSVAETATRLAWYPWRLLTGSTGLHDVFRPGYHFLGGWPDVLAWPARVISVAGALAWIYPRLPAGGRVASLAFALGGFYVSYIPPFPWYYPGWQVLGLIAWAYILHALWTARAGTAAGSGPFAAGARIAGTLLVVLQASLFLCVAWQMRTQQALIETGHRREIGLWLKANAARSDTVFLEPLGYIGYHSGLKMLDFPGLCAPEVVRARRTGRDDFAHVIDALQPGWLVLRPPEAAQAFATMPALKARYAFVRAFDQKDAIEAIPLLPGRGYLTFDAIFLVYRRADAARP